MVTCKNCKSLVPDTHNRCLTCGTHAGFQNVRAAEEQAEIDALETRYAAALEEAQKRGCNAAVTQFDDSMRKTFAVINVDLLFLVQFLTKNNVLYSTYQLGVRAQTRKAAAPENDRHRTGVEAILFGSYGAEIRYAALSLGGSGLKSYEDYSIRLRDIAIRDRASLLEENSYTFVECHKLRPGRPIPSGYRATWAERHKLAVAKLAGRVSSGTTEADFADLLLANSGNRANDDFIEVHIYGPLDNNAIESVRGKTELRNKSDRAHAANAREHLSKMGKVWIEA